MLLSLPAVRRTLATCGARLPSLLHTHARTATNKLQEERLLDIFMPPDLGSNTARKLWIRAWLHALTHAIIVSVHGHAVV